MPIAASSPAPAISSPATSHGAAGQAFLLKHPGATIIYDLRAIRAVKDGSSDCWRADDRVGPRSSAADGHETPSPRVTGHYYFATSPTPTTASSALLILELMSKRQPLRDLLQRSGALLHPARSHQAQSMNDAANLRPTSSIQRRERGEDGWRVEKSIPDWHFTCARRHRAVPREPLVDRRRRRWRRAGRVLEIIRGRGNNGNLEGERGKLLGGDGDRPPHIELGNLAST